MKQATETPKEPTTQEAEPLEVNVKRLVSCDYCHLPIESSFIGTGTGRAHSICYYKANPPKKRNTFSEVLNNCDDQVYVRELLEHLTPKYIKDQIVSDFNTEMLRRHELRISDS